MNNGNEIKPEQEHQQKINNLYYTNTNYIPPKRNIKDECMFLCCFPCLIYAVFDIFKINCCCC